METIQVTFWLLGEDENGDAKWLGTFDVPCFPHQTLADVTYEPSELREKWRSTLDVTNVSCVLPGEDHKAIRFDRPIGNLCSMNANELLIYVVDSDQIEEEVLEEECHDLIGN
jgi:hypothetical protein